MRGPGKSRRLLRRALAAALLLICVVRASPAAAAPSASPDVALATLLASARARAAQGCAKPHADLLVDILCAGRIRIGVKTDYAQFGSRDGGNWSGYEIDLAHVIAGRLGVRADFVGVSAADRISALAEGRIDLAIATIGHNTQRDGQALFIRPHYYQSETVLVGERNAVIGGWKDVAGRTVCVPVGNGSNAELFTHGARLLLFDSPLRLLDALRSGACSLVAHDDSVFAAPFMNPDFAARFSAKLGFAPMPWGMAVPLTGAERLAEALGLILQMLHRDGDLLAMASNNHIATGFLQSQQRVWRRPECDVVTGNRDPACILPPLATELQPTRFAEAINRLEFWLTKRTGVDVSLPMLTSVPAWSLMTRGVMNTLILVAGALVATFGFALGFGAMLGAPYAVLRLPARLVVIALQSSPVVLTLVIAIAFANEVAPFSAATALAAAIVALGLTNGANAAQAISESVATLRLEQRGRDLRGGALFIRAVEQASKQIQAFLVNATKGTPVASFIGAPELLNALTDINSFSSTHLTTYVFMLGFYLVAVIVVVRLCDFVDWLVAPADGVAGRQA